MSPPLFDGSRHAPSSSSSQTSSTSKPKRFRRLRSKMATVLTNQTGSEQSSPSSVFAMVPNNHATSLCIKPTSLTLIERSAKELAYESVQDTLAVMRQLESTVYRAYATPSSNLNPLHLSWRRKILDWMYAICEYCKLAPSAVGGAAHYFDVAANHGLLKELSDYQVAGVACLYLALKVFDSPLNRVVRLQSLVQLGNGKFGNHEVLIMEANIIGALNWRLHPPTAHCFVEQFVRLLDCGDDADIAERVTNKLLAAAVPYVKACTVDEGFQEVARRPSVVAYAALTRAIDEATENFTLSFSETQKFLHNLTLYAGIDSFSAGVPETRSAMHKLVQPAPTSIPPSAPSTPVRQASPPVPKASPVASSRSDSMSSEDTIHTTNSIMPRASAIIGSSSCYRSTRGLSSLVRNLTSKLSSASLSGATKENDSPNSVVDGPERPGRRFR